MAEIAGGIRRLQADGLWQFTMTATVVHPAAVTYELFDPLGAALGVSSISPVNSGVTVQESAIGLVTSTGLFHIEYVLPTTPGFYTGVWKAFNVASQPGIIRDEFEVVKTEPRSFRSYGNVADIVRTARVMFKAYDITARDVQDYMEPADNQIDAMLGMIMAVPVMPTPAKLRDCNKAMALWGMYSDRFAEVKREAPPGIKAHYDACMKFFADVMSGNAVLVTDSGAIQLARTFGSTTQDFKPVFDMREPKSWRVDPDLIDAIKDEDDQ